MDSDSHCSAPPPDASPQRPADERQQLCRLARDEACVNRAELESLYERGAALLDDVRYAFLWQLVQLDGACRALERSALQTLCDSRSANELRERIAAQMLHAAELRQRALGIANGERNRAQSRASRVRATILLC